MIHHPSLRSLFAPLLALTAAVAVPGLSGDEADAFFDDSYVHEIRLTFDDDGWYSTLYNSHDSDDEDPYFPASFTCDGLTIAQIGVRMKGNSSFRINSIKKSLKLDFDEFDEDNDELSFFGLKKLNLNNGYKDPTLMREKLFLDFASQFIPTIRTVFVRVYVNDTYLGLYTAVEQVDKNFVQSRWGGGEDGNLYKGTASDDLADAPQADFGSDLAWEGSDESVYHDHYQLKTNEEADDYSGLVEMINVLNNGDPADFPTTLEPLMDVNNVLAGLALNSLFGNSDSYTGSAHNFYVYQSDQSGQFSHILWDTNESFGSFTLFNDRSADIREVHPFWVPSRENRPLMEQLWENEAYAQQYLIYHAEMLRNGFDETTMAARIAELADLIRADVYADAYKQYSNSAFELNLTSSYSGLYGLQDFVAGRADYLEGILAAYADQADFRINEIVAQNSSGYVDGAGEADPWIELYNGGVGTSSLSGLYLSDAAANPLQWALPDVSVADGEFYVLWIDGESAEGSDHAGFALSASGGTLYLSDRSGTLIDSISYPALASIYSYQRYPDGHDTLSFSDQSTPGATNEVSATASVVLYLNELQAVNTETIQDPDGTGFPDWFEIYNPNAFAVDLGGMYLTDDAALPKQWQIPAGVQIGAGAYLLFWADNDEEQGDTHTNFKLSSGGEELALYDRDEQGNVLIDWVVFGEQAADISYGRSYDGSDTFAFFTDPTPGSTNGAAPLTTFWGYEVQTVNGEEWIDTRDWMDWLIVNYRPWAWSYNLSAWLYLSEAAKGAQGGWIYFLDDGTNDRSATGDGSYFGFTTQPDGSDTWVDTGSWIGWIEVSGAPWIWSVDAGAWFYFLENDPTSGGHWAYGLF